MTVLKPVGEQRSVALAHLELSADNVRSADGEDPALPQLKASIAALGVLTPLVVVPIALKGQRKTGERFAVLAGGRRFRALRALADDMAISDNYQVPVVVRDAADPVVEISLAENVLRAALKPHEEYAAFARMAKDGIAPAAIAEHFGVTVRRVEQLLRLGNLAEPVFTAFATGKISVPQAQAFAATADHALQAKVFDAIMKGWMREPYHIRHMILGDGSAALQQLKFVGLDAYTEAGGRFDADLFGRDALEGRVLDPEILARLHGEKEAAALEALKAAHPQVEISDGVQWNSGQRIRGEKGPLAGGAKAEAERLTAQIAERRQALDALCDDYGDLIDEANETAASDLSDAIDVLQDRLEELEESAPTVFDPADIPEGCKIVARPYLSGTEIGLQDFQLVPADWSPENPVEMKAQAGGASGSAAAAAKPTGGWPFVKAEYGLSEASGEVMRGHRLMILQAAIMNDGDIGADLMTFVTLRAIVGKMPAFGAPIAYRPERDPFILRTEEVASQAGHRSIVARLEEMERRWLEEDDTAAAWPMFLDLGAEERKEWASYAATQILARSLNAPGLEQGLHDAIAAELVVRPHLRDHWTPDRAYWARVPKKHRLAALASIDPELEAQSKKLDNDMLIERCVGVFSGDQALIAKIIPTERAAKAAIAAAEWVPEYLQFRDLTPVNVEPLGLGGSDGIADPIPEAAE